jgi:hypothetical protein
MVAVLLLLLLLLMRSVVSDEIKFVLRGLDAKAKVSF